MDVNRSIIQDLISAEITIGGSYCLGENTHKILDPSFYERSGEYEMDSNDLRLPHSRGSFGDREPPKDLSTIPIVLYIVVTTHLGSTLHERIPELDSYIQGLEKPNLNDYTPEFESFLPKQGKLKPNNEPDKFRHGTHRVFHRDNGLMSPTIGIQLKLNYGRSLVDLISVERWETPYFDLQMLKSWINVCEHEYGQKREIEDAIVPLPSGFRVIDVNRMCVVEPLRSPTPKFVALSYTWGNTSGAQDVRLEKSKSQRPRKGRLALLYTTTRSYF